MSPRAPASAATLEDRLAACQKDSEALTQETLDLYRQVNLLFRIGASISESSTRERLCELVLRECTRILRASGGRIELNDGFVQGTIPAQVESRLTVAIEHTGGHLGVVTLYDKKQQDFTSADEKLLRAVARQAGIALENQRLIQGLVSKNQELERLNEELKVLDRLKSDFVSNVSHEIRTPLASIKGFAATILDDREMPPDIQREFIGIINDESEKLCLIINDILDLSKVMSGHMKFDLGLHRMEDLASAALRSLEVLAQRKGITLAFEPVDALWVHVDPARMGQVLTNLIGNAVKFTDRGSVRVTQWRDGDEACLAVEDTGIGIDAQHLPRIFEKFYRVENVVHTKEGTGLGLALVKTLVTRLRGRVEVRSEPGVGSTFTVRMPRVNRPDDGESSGGKANPDHR